MAAAPATSMAEAATTTVVSYVSFLTSSIIVSRVSFLPCFDTILKL